LLRARNGFDSERRVTSARERRSVRSDHPSNPNCERQRNRERGLRNRLAIGDVDVLGIVPGANLTEHSAQVAREVHEQYEREPR